MRLYKTSYLGSRHTNRTASLCGLNQLAAAEATVLVQGIPSDSAARPDTDVMHGPPHTSALPTQDATSGPAAIDEEESAGRAGADSAQPSGTATGSAQSASPALIDNAAFIAMMRSHVLCIFTIFVFYTRYPSNKTYGTLNADSMWE